MEHSVSCRFRGASITDLPSEGLLVNFMGLSIVVFGVLVLFLATKSDFKRKPLPEDTMLLTGQNE